MLDTRRLKLFCVVAETGSITAAASRVHLTQPAISQQIALLEREIGAPLIERLPRGIRLTEPGKLLAERGRAILRELAGLEEQVRASATERAQIRLGVFSTAGANLVPRLVQAYRLEYPQTRLILHASQPEALEAELNEGLIDVGLSWDYDFLPRSFANLHRQRGQCGRADDAAGAQPAGVAQARQEGAKVALRHGGARRQRLHAPIAMADQRQRPAPLNPAGSQFVRRQCHGRKGAGESLRARRGPLGAGAVAQQQQAHAFEGPRRGAALGDVAADHGQCAGALQTRVGGAAAQWRARGAQIVAGALQQLQTIATEAGLHMLVGARQRSQAALRIEGEGVAGAALVQAFVQILQLRRQVVPIVEHLLQAVGDVRGVVRQAQVARDHDQLTVARTIVVAC